MFENSGTRNHTAAGPRTWSLWRSLWSTTLALLASCSVGLASEPFEVSHSAVETARQANNTQEPHELRLAGLIPVSELWDNPSDPLLGLLDEPITHPGVFLAEPPMEFTGPIAVLLPPQPIESAVIVPSQPAEEEAETEIVQAPQTTLAADIASKKDIALEPVPPTPAPPAIDGLSEQERLLVARVIRDCSEAATGVLTDARVDEIATTKIRQANALANRGAQYAARKNLIEVLRMISQAKDAQQGNRQFTSALAAGFRALDEAEDFAPRGTQLEGELELDLITAAHRTPIARQSVSSNVLPRQMMDRYFRYAQLKLAMSVADEPAGSMALYALGKVTSQMGKSEPQRHRLAHRRAVAFQQAALLAHNQNHLAAHELAVLLAESGHFGEAQNLFLQVATREPNATVYENLAQVQQSMGLTEQAAIGHALAARLARQGPAGANHIRWLAPEEFIHTGGGSGQLTPSRGNRPLPMVRRPRYDRRTAIAPSSPAPMRSAGLMPPPNWR